MTRFSVLARNLDFPEGPSVADDGTIWFSELRGGRICQWASGTVTRFEVGGMPNGTTWAPDGTLWFCDAERNQIRCLEPRSGKTTVVVDAIDGVALNAPNDLAFHPDGGLVFTCPGDSRQVATGYLGRRSSRGHVSRAADGFLFPNGICFSADGAMVHFAETYACQVMSASWSEDLDFQTLFPTPGPIGADGVAVAADGAVFTTVYGTGVMCAFNQARGEVGSIAVPDAHPAGCAIDPLTRWDLLITGTETGVLLGVSL